MERLQRDHWLMMSWELAAGQSATPEAIVRRIRRGAELGRYWLRAYVVLGRKVSLLLYPLAALDAVQRELREIVGGSALLRMRSIADDSALERSATYIEHLPIRTGLVRRAEDYGWSSAGWIAALPGRGVTS